MKFPLLVYVAATLSFAQWGGGNWGGGGGKSVM